MYTYIHIYIYIYIYLHVHIYAYLYLFVYICTIGLTGGKNLRAEAMGGGIRESQSRVAMKTLRDTLLSSETAVPLLLLIAQIRSRILFNTDTPQLKLISHLFDTAQDVLMQFTDFLGTFFVFFLQHFFSSLYIFIYIYTYINIWICIYMYTHVYTCIHIYMYTCIYIYIHIYIYIYIYTYIYIYIHIYTYYNPSCWCEVY
jgi:hypothetical protein